MEDKKYKIFPVLILAFFRVALGVAISLAVPIHLINIDLESQYIGIITSGTAMAYLFSPLVFRNVHKKLGLRITLILSTSGFLLIQIIMQFTLDPWILYLLLIIDGTFLGFFWPDLMTIISIVSNQKKYFESQVRKNRLMKSYSLSWNLGGVFSFILGSIVLFFIDNNLLMFDFALIFAIVGVIFAFLIQNPETKKKIEVLVPLDNGLKCIPIKDEATFPIYIPLIIIAIYGFLISGVGLAYPLKSDLLNYAVFTNYLFYAIRLTSQTIAITKSMDLKLTRIKQLLPYSTIILTLILILMAINQNLIIFSILFFVFGTFSAIHYTISFKLIVFKNVSEKTSKYSAYFETMVGIGFFFGPIILGFIVNLGIDVGFFFLAGLSVLSLTFYLLKRKNLRIQN
ncbi:MAG: MFS transporter [Promethearchaeota archaeon]|nr:MAG: MFS transporter [Candidatus Lokiarchaeota archaeon]